MDFKPDSSVAMLTVCGRYIAPLSPVDHHKELLKHIDGLLPYHAKLPCGAILLDECGYAAVTGGPIARRESVSVSINRVARVAGDVAEFLDEYFKRSSDLQKDITEAAECVSALRRNATSAMPAV